MPLSAFGYDGDVEGSFRDCAEPGWVPGRVLTVDGESCTVAVENGELRAEASGRLLYAAESPLDLPAVGDWVCLQPYEDGSGAVIHRILPRRTVLCRKRAGRSSALQLIAANIDCAFVVSAFDRGVNLRGIERYLAAVKESGAGAAVVLNKTDLAAPAAVEEALRLAEGEGADRVVALSAATGAGMEALEALLEPAKTFCLLGPSGAGKTTLLNRLAARELSPTTPVRTGDAKGRHTTTRRQLFLLRGGAVMIDTPGMREFGTAGTEEGIAATFPEIEALTGECRFRDCTHTEEKGCAVREALEAGAIDEGRCRSWLKLRREAARHEMSELERRRRDRSFGRLCRAVMKEKKKRR